MGDNTDPFMRNQNAAVRGNTKGQNRANIGQSHPTGLTANLLKLFEPRPPLEYKPPPEKRKCPPYTGMAQFVSQFAEPGEPEYAPPVQKAETPAQRRARIHKLRLEKGAEKAAEELQKYDPNNDPNISGDPYKTLFVARLNYETTESRIKREFESYGPIKRVRLITDKATSKPRGYAFIEYMHTRDMKAAYKQADGRKLDGRRVLVDVERGRTVPNWRPRRLGGGLGTTRVGGEEVNQRYSGREVQQSGGSSRSEEPRAREDRHIEREREKSRERGRDREREREKSRERSHDRPRDRDHREDRHNRDRDRERDRERERERGRDRDRDRDRTRDRDRGRDRGREYERDRDRDRGRDHDRDRTRERERDYEVGENDRGRSHDRESDYDRVESKHERDRRSERDYEHAEPEDDRGWYEQPEQGHGRQDTEDDQRYDHYEHHRSRGKYDHMDVRGDHDRYEQYPDHDHDRYERMDQDDYHYDHGTSESLDRENEYRRSERSHSREYDN
ncbi:U1 small nuclear ribonucleoprotein 70 kDa isoform X2 [Jatropha curcas]|uniref:U1 small nuclear ribonucleoprotein 70 kDa isoform X2 n=1 Tax=Jatropha curcas TaxID=180498 RepID=UPI0005FB2617|nr:U1 small nuclear ribonucleoprotein 70 kDa isoform X2 [Jatropha curcas]